MQKQTLTFDQLPEYIFELGRKVDYLTTLFSSPSPPPDETGGVPLAREVTGLSSARIYALVSARAIPHAKRGNRLFFNRTELFDWIKQGKRDEKGPNP